MHIARNKVLDIGTFEAFSRLLELVRSAVASDPEKPATAYFIMDQAALLVIRTYERESLALPTTLPGIRQHLGFGQSVIPGLSAEDFLTSYRAIRQHGMTWRPVETQIGNAGSGLHEFAIILIDQGDRILECIDRMSLMKQLERSVGDMDLPWITAIPVVQLDEHDQSIITEFLHYLQNIADRIRQHEDNSTALHQALSRFSTTLQTQIVPDMQHKVRLIGSTALDQQVRHLDERIARQLQAIDNLGPAPVRPTGRRHGADLAHARAVRQYHARLNALHQALQDLRQSRQEILNLRESLASHHTRLERLVRHMNEAQGSASTLQQTWKQMLHGIGLSARRLRAMDTSADLLGFAHDWASLLTPWRIIQQALASAQVQGTRPWPRVDCNA